MRSSTTFSFQRMLAGWAVFGSGLIVILWLHTLTDSVAHWMILPLLLLFWTALGVCIWDGSKSFALKKRIAFISAQAAVAAIGSILVISHFLYHSP